MKPVYLTNYLRAEFSLFSYTNFWKEMKEETNNALVYKNKSHKQFANVLAVKIWYVFMFIGNMYKNPKEVLKATLFNMWN